MEKQDNKNDLNDLPPFFKTWKGLYIFVIGHLIFLIVAFYLITKFFE